MFKTLTYLNVSTIMCTGNLFLMKINVGPEQQQKQKYTCFLGIDNDYFILSDHIIH